MILAIPTALLLLALVVLPRLWVLSVMRRHAGSRSEIPWTGGEFARHLLDRMKLSTVKVEETERGDHYHPLAKSVRLSAENFHGRSLTAVVVAAHEVGHAMQDATGYAPLQTRTRIAGAADFIHKVGAVLIIASPVLAALLRHPGGLVIGLAAAVLMNLSAVVMHAVTLPVEFDASFNRAMVVLKHGKFIPEEEMGAARHILSAAAYTYVASALIDLVNLPRLVRGLWV
jgi:Zn-dependent membrane protease YugP